MDCYVSQDMKRYNHLLSEMDAAYHDMSLKLGISDSAMIVLYTICNKGDRCQLQDICRLSGVSKQTINSAIRKLETEGMVVLQPVGTKQKMVCLTEKGKQLAQNTAVRMMKAENEILASWPKQDVSQYLELTERFLHEFKQKTQSMHP